MSTVELLDITDIVIILLPVGALILLLEKCLRLLAALQKFIPLVQTKGQSFLLHAVVKAVNSM